MIFITLYVFNIVLLFLFEGNGSVVVNGVPVLPGESTILRNNAVVDFSNLRFIFLVNLELNEAIRSEAIKNKLVKSLS